MPARPRERSSLTVPEVLDAVGHPQGPKGRTSCPLHQGRNRETFRYSTHGWLCQAGCGQGNARQLAVRLGLRIDAAPSPDPTLPKIGGFFGAVGYDDAPLPSRRLMAEAERYLRERQTALAALHGRAEGYRRDLARLALLTRSQPERRAFLTALMGSLVRDLRLCYATAHRGFGSSDCCRDERLRF